MEKQPTEQYFCKEHMGVILRVTKGGKVIDYVCSEEGESLTVPDTVMGMAWIFTWADFCLEDDPFDY
jgi:hypothetical protein